MNAASMLFDFETVRWLLMVAIGGYTWFIGRQSASAAELLDLRMRVTTLEAQMKQVPDQKNFHELVERIASVTGSVDAIKAGMEPLTHSVRRVETYLMENK